MATSGSTNYTMTARDVITYALQKLNVIGAGETVAAGDADYGLIELNLMLKSWQMSGPNLWRQTEGSQTLTANTASYTLLTKPYRIIDCRYRDTSGRDMPMELLTRAEYYDMPLKTNTGIPTQYYFDPQRANGTLYIWPVLAAATTESVQYTYQRRFDDVDTLDEEVDVPQEFLSLLGHALAVQMAPPYGTDVSRLEKLVDRMMMQAMSADREPVVRFSPDMRG